jgi:hypothetical protein
MCTKKPYFANEKRTERRSIAGEWLFGKNIMNV